MTTKQTDTLTRRPLHRLVSALCSKAKHILQKCYDETNGDWDEDDLDWLLPALAAAIVAGLL